MTSVIKSSRQATASVFDMFNSASSAITKSVGSASKGLDILHAKVDVMHHAQMESMDLRKQYALDKSINELEINHAVDMVTLAKELSDPAVKAYYDKLQANKAKS